MSESATYLNGTISVKRRSDDYMAWRIGDTALWALGSSPREAIGNLVMTHPDEIVAAALAARPDRDAAALEAQLRIAVETLNLIAQCGCSACGPSPRDVAHARTLADDALTRMSVAGDYPDSAALAATDRTAPTERRGGDEPSLPPLSSTSVELDITEVREGTPGVYPEDD